MLIKMEIGGINVYFGEPFAEHKPEPFYPYLISVDPIQDSTGEETGSTIFTLTLAANRIIELHLRKRVWILNDDMTVAFEGLTSHLIYKESLAVTLEA